MPIESLAEACTRRRRCASTTRAAILDAAALRFAREGYERAGVRAIAADAGVTGALVNRYFGSKEALFAEVIETNLCLDELANEVRATLAERLARKMVYGWEEEDKPEDETQDLTPLLLLLRSATEPRAAELLRHHLDNDSLKTLANVIGGPDGRTRAALIISQMLGFATLYRMIQAESLTGADRERLVATLTASLRVCIG